ncbi:MAG: hypothetical protein AAGC65_21360 [Mucilaginibacter sp.]|uniref:hypothetical protein n=1 Tax=Mucilaginibacter sp. TaxID=1882438 RepID=UPI0031ACC4FB
MATNRLIQKSWTSKKEISIEADHIAIRTKTIKDEMEYIIKLGELGFETIKRTDKTANLSFYTFLVFTMLDTYLLVTTWYSKGPLAELILWMFGFIFFAALCLYSFSQRNKEIIYLGGGQKVLELLAAKPDKQTVLLFIDEIHAAIRAYYKNKYSHFDSSIPYDVKISTLSWLKEMKAITNEEFEDLSARQKTESIIGFKSQEDHR